ncbi:phage-like protein [Asticcacaulis biprosthecium C19]|uniref:Phage-like protein n=1 Tax=Asticcacaulis biprosthecium C19 TaxID=715226 RepID=F4QGC2_9CAUL|nr:DUF3164 family protein [Asticcacaulis biprosthecium]EGF92450.1 phage-like protein [Asticcacaulis biprosthecium C19]
MADDCTKKGVLELAQEQYEAEVAGGIPAIGKVIDGVEHLMDNKGRWTPVVQFKPADLLMDQTVRKMLGFAEPLAAQVARFRQHSFDDVDSLLVLLAEQYGAKAGGQKGNITLTTVDGLMQVKVQVADNIAFGPELQVAKSLVDECLKDWTDGARAELRTLVDRAFQVDKEGKINRGELLGLRRLNIEDERWVRAMQAVADSIRVIGSKRYVRCYRRDTQDGDWKPIVIDVAAS